MQGATIRRKWLALPEKFDAIDKEEAVDEGGGVKLEHQLMHGIMSAPGCVRFQINVDRQLRNHPFCLWPPPLHTLTLVSNHKNLISRKLCCRSVSSEESWFRLRLPFVQPLLLRVWILPEPGEGFLLFASLSLCLSLLSGFVLFFFFAPPVFLLLRLYVFLPGLVIKTTTITQKQKRYK